MYTIEEFDYAKTKILKYILYKKRTEKVVKTKFRNIISQELLEDVIEELKQIGYINDQAYIKRAIQEMMALKSLSVKEIQYKLLAKGILLEDVEQYIAENQEELQEYERNSAKNIVYKKMVGKEEYEIRSYLLKKGYQEENINDAIKLLEE